MAALPPDGATGGDAGNGGSNLGARVQGAITHAAHAVHAAMSGLAAGDALAGGDSRDRPERVLSASFGTLESPGGGAQLRCLFLTYPSGWQAWEVECGACGELISLRDGPVTYVLPVPNPERTRSGGGGEGEAVPDDVRPLVAVAGPDAPPAPPPSEARGESGGESVVAPQAPPASGASLVRFFSVRSQGYVRKLSFRSPVLALRATSRVVAVALDSQVYGLDTATLEARPPPCAHTACCKAMLDCVLRVSWFWCADNLRCDRARSSASRCPSAC
jgi:hypothetical protein